MLSFLNFDSLNNRLVRTENRVELQFKYVQYKLAAIFRRMPSHRRAEFRVQLLGKKSMSQIWQKRIFTKRKPFVLWSDSDRKKYLLKKKLFSARKRFVRWSVSLYRRTVRPMRRKRTFKNKLNIARRTFRQLGWQFLKANLYFLRKRTFFRSRFERQLRLEAGLGLSLNDLLFSNRIVRKVFRTRPLLYSMRGVGMLTRLLPLQLWLNSNKKLIRQFNFRRSKKFSIKRRLVLGIIFILKHSKVFMTREQLKYAFKLGKYILPQKKNNILSFKRPLGRMKLLRTFSDLAVSNVFMSRLGLQYRSWEGTFSSLLLFIQLLSQRVQSKSSLKYLDEKYYRRLIKKRKNTFFVKDFPSDGQGFLLTADRILKKDDKYFLREKAVLNDSIVMSSIERFLSLFDSKSFDQSALVDRKLTSVCYKMTKLANTNLNKPIFDTDRLYNLLESRTRFALIRRWFADSYKRYDWANKRSFLNTGPVRSEKLLPLLKSLYPNTYNKFKEVQQEQVVAENMLKVTRYIVASYRGRNFWLTVVNPDGTVAFSATFGTLGFHTKNSRRSLKLPAITLFDKFKLWMNSRFDNFTKYNYEFRLKTDYRFFRIKSYMKFFLHRTLAFGRDHSVLGKVPLKQTRLNRLKFLLNSNEQMLISESRDLLAANCLSTIISIPLLLRLNTVLGFNRTTIGFININISQLMSEYIEKLYKRRDMNFKLMKSILFDLVSDPIVLRRISLISRVFLKKSNNKSVMTTVIYLFKRRIFFRVLLLFKETRNVLKCRLDKEVNFRLPKQLLKLKLYLDKMAILAEKKRMVSRKLETCKIQSKVSYIPRFNRRVSEAEPYANVALRLLRVNFYTNKSHGTGIKQKKARRK